MYIYMHEKMKKREKGEVYILFSYANILYFNILYLKFMNVTDLLYLN